jgi:hypothetical protein
LGAVITPQQPPTTIIVQQASSTSGLAIAGFVCSLLGFLTCGLLSIPGALFSFIALFRPGRQGLAVAGLILGFPGVLFFAFVGMSFLAVIFGFGAAADEALKQAERRANQPPPTILAPAGFETVGSHIHGANNTICRLTVFCWQPNGTDIAKHILSVKSQYPTSYIQIDYYDDRSAAVASRVVPGGFGDNADKLIPDWTYKHLVADYWHNESTNRSQLLFRRDVPDGEPSDDSEVTSLVSKKNTPSGTMADLDDEEEAGPTTDESDWIKKREDERRAKAVADRQRQEAEKARLKAEEDAKFRIWTASNGTKSPEARIVSYANGIITIEKRDGKKAKVPLDKLSEPDKEYVAKWRKER